MDSLRGSVHVRKKERTQLKNQQQTRTTPKGWARAAAALSRTAHLKFVLPCNTLYLVIITGWEAVVEQAKRMRAWRENGSLSGLPLAAVGRKVVVEVERRSRVSVARRERWVQEHAGKREMRDGRWAVARVVEARRTKTGGVLALVEWKGVDPASGVAWENSWVSLRDLSVAARPEAKALLPARARRACWEYVAASSPCCQHN